MRIPALILLSLNLAACGSDARPTAGEWTGTVDTLASGTVVVRNPAQGVWDEASAWTVEEELRLGTADGDGPELFGSIYDVAVDPAGRIYVLDQQAQEVRVFDAEGAYLRTIGRKGGGPGEFEHAVGMRWDSEGRLWVVDTRNARYSAFDTAGVYQTAVRRESGFTRVPWIGGFDGEGRLWDSAMRFDAKPGEHSEILVAFRADPDAPAPLDTLWLPTRQGERFMLLYENGLPRMSATVPFTTDIAWHFDPARQRLWSADTDRYRIALQDVRGDTLRIIERAHQPLPVTAEDRRKAIEGLAWFTEQGGKVDASRIPSVKPALGSFFTDDQGYLWVWPTTTSEDAGPVLDVFDPEGRYLGRVRLPFPVGYFRPLIVGDRIYAITQDELEVPYVVRARIVGRGAAVE
jgi:sugar lactone lactonase YvrE